MLPKIIKEKKGIPTVIEWEGKRYVLDLKTKSKSNDSKPVPNLVK